MSLNLTAYENAHRSAAIFDCAGWGKIEVAGTDHSPFLHNILSQNMLGMQTGEWRETALLSATSHVLAYLFAVKLEDSILLLAPRQLASRVSSLLDKFLITEDVQIKDAENILNLFEVWGPSADTLIQGGAQGSMLYKPEGLQGPRTLVLAKKTASVFINETLGDKNSREVLRIENGILEFGADFNETIMLSETRLEKKCASETKGCYPGQEVVAKIETYKRLNRSFVRLVIDDEKFGAVAVNNFASETSAQPAQPELPAVGSVIIDQASGAEIGRLTSRAYSPFLNKTAGLGWLKRGFFEQPTEVMIQSESAVPAQTALFEN